MEIINKYTKLFQWIFLLAVFFGLCIAIDVPEGYKFIRAQAEYRIVEGQTQYTFCLLYTSPRPRDATLSRMPSSA